MSLYATPEAHAANPPETWTVVRLTSHPGARARFGIVIEQGKRHHFDTFGTRADAERAIANPNSWLRKLYEKERTPSRAGVLA